MTRREAVLSALLVFGVALVVRTYFAAQIVFPKPEDTAYYVGVARNLLDGRGLVSDALWSYQTPPLVFPRPAFEVWLPLPTFLAAIPMAIFGSTFAAAQVSSVLVGSIVPVLAWRLAADVAGELRLSPLRARWLALGSGLTAAVYLPLVLASALPDSTMPFAAIVLAATLLMTRLVRDPRGARIADPRLLVLGVLLGLGALTRNETAWLALIWAAIAWFATPASPAVRARLVLVAAVVAMVVFAPWVVRNIQELGTPLPGQAITNALYLTGYDIFAWNDPPTVERHLSLGAGGLLELRARGLGHNLFSVLVLLGIPLSVIGILSLPWSARARALRPLAWLSLIMFVVTSLVFPAATQWGTFLHGAGPVHVLIVIAAMATLDAGLARLADRLRWEKSVAWLGAVIGISTSLLFSFALLPTFATGSRATAALYEQLGERMAAGGRPLDASAGPVISNFPIWIAETLRIPSLALPDEPPADVLDLATSFPGTRYLVLTNPEGVHWPADLATDAPGADCFTPIDLPAWTGTGIDPLAETTVYEIACPAPATGDTP